MDRAGGGLVACGLVYYFGQNAYTDIKMFFPVNVSIIASVFCDDRYTVYFFTINIADSASDPHYLFEACYTCS